MPDLDQLIAALWKPFLGDVRGGGPVFFGFSAEFLADLLRNQGIETSDPVKTIGEAASQLFVVSREDAVLTDKALREGKSGFSPAIVLVCQQVLAVEEMVREPTGFSENAYFPRLRRLMSPNLPQLSLNPFTFDDFEIIWRTLAKEIRSIQGSTDASITFRFGVETGVNKARSFPLSQGLLSLEDLRVIVSEIGLRRLRSAAPADMWRLLKRVRFRLGRRGQRLIGLGIFRDRVIDQVVAYANKADAAGTANVSADGPSKEVVEFGIYKDSTDWLSEEYRPILTIVETGDRIHSGARLAEELNRLVRNAEALILPLGELGDYWTCASRTTSIRPNDSFLILGTSQSIDQMVERLEEARVGLRLSKQSHQGIGVNDNVRVLEAAIATDALHELTVKEGRIIETSIAADGAQYEWIGGTSVDNRRLRFLRESLPTAIHFGSLHYAIRNMRKINNHAIGFEGFQVVVRDAAEDLSLEVSFDNDRTARLGVAIRRRGGDEYSGYVVDEGGTIVPSVDRISESDFAIIGCAEHRRESVQGLSIALCAQLIRGLRGNRGATLSAEQLATITRRLLVSRVPPPVKNAVISLLHRDPHLPGALVAVLAHDSEADRMRYRN